MVPMGAVQGCGSNDSLVASTTACRSVAGTCLVVFICLFRLAVAECKPTHPAVGLKNGGSTADSVSVSLNRVLVGSCFLALWDESRIHLQSQAVRSQPHPWLRATRCASDQARLPSTTPCRPIVYRINRTTWHGQAYKKTLTREYGPLPPSSPVLCACRC